MKCELCKSKIINAIAYKIKKDKYICLRCYANVEDAEEVIITNGIEQKEVIWEAAKEKGLEERSLTI